MIYCLTGKIIKKTLDSVVMKCVLLAYKAVCQTLTDLFGSVSFREVRQQFSLS